MMRIALGLLDPSNPRLNTSNTIEQDIVLKKLGQRQSNYFFVQLCMSTVLCFRGTYLTSRICFRVHGVLLQLQGMCKQMNHVQNHTGTGFIICTFPAIVHL